MTTIVTVISFPLLYVVACQMSIRFLLRVAVLSRRQDIAATAEIYATPHGSAHSGSLTRARHTHMSRTPVPFAPHRPGTNRGDDDAPRSDAST